MRDSSRKHSRRSGASESHKHSESSSDDSDDESKKGGMESFGMGNALVAGMLSKSKSSKHPADIGTKLTVN